MTSIPLHCEPLGKTIRVGVQQSNDDDDGSGGDGAVARTVSAGMLRELIAARFGPEAALTAEDGSVIPDSAVIWSRSSDGTVSLRPDMKISASQSRSGSATGHGVDGVQQQEEPQLEKTNMAMMSPQDAEARRDAQRAQFVGSPLQRETIQRHQRQLKVAQTLLETDRMRWTQQLEVLRTMRDVALNVLGIQRLVKQQAANELQFPPLEELARRLEEEQHALDLGAPAADAKRSDIRDAEQLLDTLQQGVTTTLQEAGVIPPPSQQQQHMETAVPAQYAAAARFLRESIFKLALRKVQLQSVQDEMSMQRQMLDALRYQRRAIVEQAEDTGGHVRVVVRQRPYLDLVDGAQPKRVGPAEVGEALVDEKARAVTVFSPATGGKTFEFVRVFGPPTMAAAVAAATNRERQQEQIFDEEVVPLLRDAISHGTDATILLYGPTSSGKSYTAFGDGLSAPGLLELALTEVMHFSGEADLQATELYLDHKSDLLLSSSDAASTSGDSAWHRVKSVAAALKLVSRAAQRRVTASTLTNDVSSRSHLIFSIRFPNTHAASVIGFEQPRVTKLTFVDLAGCERVSRSMSTGERLREAQHINKSLSALGDVVHALSNRNAQHIPYRNSKLTMMLQDALGGASRTLFMLCVPPHLPDQHNMAEIVAALTFATRTRGVRNRLTGALAQQQQQQQQQQQ